MIRPATAADAPAIAAVWNPVIRDTAITFNSVPKTAEDVATMIEARRRAGQAVLVAETGADIAGFATYFQFRGGIGYARTMEHSVVLRPEMQGRGLGGALMSGIEAHARAGGAHSLFAGVSSGNPGGLRFHARIGFRQVAVLPEVGWKFDRWFDLHLLQKML